MTIRTHAGGPETGNRKEEGAKSLYELELRESLVAHLLLNANYCFSLYNLSQQRRNSGYTPEGHTGIGHEALRGAKKYITVDLQPGLCGR